MKSARTRLRIDLRLVTILRTRPIETKRLVIANEKGLGNDCDNQELPAQTNVALRVILLVYASVGAFFRPSTISSLHNIAFGSNSKSREQRQRDYAKLSSII